MKGRVMSMTEYNPWAGLAAYQDPETTASKLLFCGRENEAYDVSLLTDENIFVTLYGKSGVGKTSLLNAGVFPRLRSMGYLPISIRLGMEPADISFQACIINRLSATLQERNGHIQSFDVTPLPSDELAQEYLWSYFARNHFSDKDGNTVFPVIVLDQFEEVFKKRKADAESLLRQLNYLMDESHALSDRIVDGQQYSYDFNYRFVLSIREDDLYSLEDSIDNNYLSAMKRCRYRLRGLTDEGAREAIVQPGEGLFDKQEEEQIVNAIIKTARNSDDSSISTNVLSLICSRLYIESCKAGDHLISAQLVDSYLAGNPFEQYYNEATSGFSNKERSYIERHLIDSSGRRNSVSESDFFLHVKNGEALLEGPQKILQRVSVSSDSKDNRIELIHDSFCAPLAELRTKRQLRRRLRMIMVSVCVAALSILVASVIFYQKHQVEELNQSMLENNSRFVAEKASMLVDEGDSYTARLLSLAVLPPNRPYVIEAEAALRKACYHSSAILKGHKDCIRSVSFSEDGKQIVSSSEDGTTITWDAANGNVLSTKKLVAKTEDNTIAISTDGLFNAKVGNENTDIELYDARTGRHIHTLQGHTGKVNAIRFSPDGRLLASASDDNTIMIWDVADGEVRRTLIGHSNYATCVSFSPDGKRLVSGSEDNTVRLWDVFGNNAERNKMDEGGLMINPCFSSDGMYIASASYGDGIITIWDSHTGKRSHSFTSDRHINSICFHPTDKQILATSADSIIKIWNVREGSLLHTLSGHRQRVNSITFSQDGRYLASASQDKTIRIWDAQSCKCLQILKGHAEKINHVSFSNDGNTIASASDDKTIKVWNVKNGECLKTLSGHNDGVVYTSFSPNGGMVVSASDGNSIKIWDVETGETLKSFGNHKGKMVHVSFLSDDMMVSASNDGLIRIWNVADGTILCDLSGYIDGMENNMLVAVSLSPERHEISSVFFDGVCEHWNYPSLTDLLRSTEEIFKGASLSSEQKREYYIE